MDKNIGKKGKDTITGMEGMITARADYLHANSEYRLTPKSEFKSELMKQEWFSVDRIEALEDNKPKEVGFNKTINQIN